MDKKKQATILIVDDYPSNISVLERFLQAEDYKVLTADNGQTALGLCQDYDIDLVLLDIMMPGLDGYQVCEKLKEMPATSHIPVIFITAKIDIESIVKGFNVGGADYLTKPVNFEEVNARVKTQIKLRMQEQKLLQQDAAKNKFISIISEDLRTPIVGLRSLLKEMDKPSRALDPELMLDYISSAYLAADYLDNISLKLKYWSALQNNELPVTLRTVQILPIFDEVVSHVQAENKHKVITIINNIAPDHTAYFDEEYLRIIAINLLSNAVSFSHKESKVVIKSEVSNVDNAVLITIRDTGVGIETERLESIFQLGRHERTRGTAGEAGTGIGLVICHDLLKKCHGNIWIDSELNTGTQVTVRLPQK
ncbi:MAG: hybrid sensor histidine kinase/response regulator [Gammaproteobacteria bacterium]|nr:hybrid sensor histidine kinase/response regulator [Gammaproteobacteria bacterium]